MITPHPFFRPNPDRAIYVQGTIDQQLVNRLTPEIINLQNQSRDPITIYIDSPGGVVAHMERLLKLLLASNQDFNKACHLITVVTALAASAAADLLTSGSYALAYPDSTILYHGVRVPGDGGVLTAEVTSILARHLRANNDSYAVRLAQRIEFRFMFRFITCKDQFNDIRQRLNAPDMEDFDCFLNIISGQVSESANRALANAHQRYERYSDVLGFVLKRLKPFGNKTKAEKEARVIKAIVDFELSANKKNANWRFETEGIHRLTDDFFLFNEYLATFRSDDFRKLCSIWGGFLLNDEEKKEVNALPETEQTQKIQEIVSPQLRPIWSFFFALCHTLQEGENELTATDAFWLGLIDEVIGVQGLAPHRMIYEVQPDVQIQSKKDADTATDTPTEN
jgi:ATP-dependent protease ClpP protease subunit